MRIYRYDRAGIYLFSMIARKDPREPDRDVMPARATTIAPPAAQANRVPVWDGEAWRMEEDWRDEGFWLPEDYDFEEAPQTMIGIGPMPEGATRVRPDVPPEVAAARQAAEAEDLRIEEVSSMGRQIETLFRGMTVAQRRTNRPTFREIRESVYDDDLELALDFAQDLGPNLRSRVLEILNSAPE